MVLAIDRSAYEAIIDHAREDAPREACGVLAGQRTGTQQVVESAIRMANAADAPRVAYRIEPTALYEVITDIEAAGRSIIGFYHSHPAGPPSPSDHDRADARWVDHQYCVVSLAGTTPSFDAWQWTGAEFRPEPVTIRDQESAE